MARLNETKTVNSADVDDPIHIPPSFSFFFCGGGGQNLRINQIRRSPPRRGPDNFFQVPLLTFSGERLAEGGFVFVCWKQLKAADGGAEGQNSTGGSELHHAPFKTTRTSSGSSSLALKTCRRSRYGVDGANREPL